MSKILLYGAYGYTGELIAEAAAERGIPVVLSGRNPEKVKSLADRLNLPFVVASLDDAPALDLALEGCSAVLHCAGPFVRTFKTMAEACLRNQVHYLDITGEIDVFEGLAALDAPAQKASVMLMPGVGFDVVPTDCTAAHLKNLLPDATHLNLAFKSVGGMMSHGTASTMVMGLGQPNLQRQNGKIVPVKMGSAELMVDFGRGAKPTAGIPWGDVSTAFYTTGIPNVATFMGVSSSARRSMKMARWIGPLLRSKFVQRRAQKRVDSAPAGPDKAARDKGFTLVWGQARNADGKTVTTRLKTMNGYNLTVAAGLYIAERVLAGEVRPGFQTPAGLYGADLLVQVDPDAGFVPVE